MTAEKNTASSGKAGSGETGSEKSRGAYVPRTPNQIMLELIQKQETRVKELKQELSIQEKELQRMKKAQAAYEAN
jgi:hypothetical protein